MRDTIKFKSKKTTEKIQESEQQVANMGTLYDMNRYFYQTMPPMNKDEQDSIIQNAAMWFSSKPGNHYFLFLCKELTDFTFFNFVSTNYAQGKEELINLINSRFCEIKDIVYNHDTDSYDFWGISVMTADIHMYKLFMCDDFVIEV